MDRFLVERKIGEVHAALQAWDKLDALLDELAPAFGTGPNFVLLLDDPYSPVVLKFRKHQDGGLDVERVPAVRACDLKAPAETARTAWGDVDVMTGEKIDRRLGELAGRSVREPADLVAAAFAEPDDDLTAEEVDAAFREAVATVAGEGRNGAAVRGNVP